MFLKWIPWCSLNDLQVFLVWLKIVKNKAWSETETVLLFGNILIDCLYNKQIYQINVLTT
jgi:hypothetical protein